MELDVGAARVDITPPLTVPYLGFVPRHAYFRGVHDPLYARAVVIGKGQQRVAWVVADSIGISRRLLGPKRDFIAEVRARIEDWCHIPSDRVMISATHAHSTPETAGIRPMRKHPGAAAWLETLRDQLASAVALADCERVPAKLKRSAGMVQGVGWSRRILGTDGRLYSWRGRPTDDQIADWGVNDHELSLLCFERADGRPEVLLAHFACHPVTVQVQPLVSADFPGAASAIVERAGVGCAHCIYVQGAGGSINPVGHDTRDFADVQRYGRILAGAIMKQLAAATESDCAADAAQVGAASRVVRVPSRPLPDPAEVERDYRKARSRLRRLTAQDEKSQAARSLLRMEEVRERLRLGDAPIHAEVQVLRIGDTAVVGIPGEPFAEMGLQIKKGMGAPSALCAGYSNDWLGYIAPPSAWDLGGYEVEPGMWSQVGPAAYNLLLNAARDLIAQLW